MFLSSSNCATSTNWPITHSIVNKSMLSGSFISSENSTEVQSCELAITCGTEQQAS